MGNKKKNYNAGDADQVHEAKLREDKKNQQVIDDIKWVMSDLRGRRFMTELFRRCGKDMTSFTGNSQTFFNEGQRNVGLMYEADLEEYCFEENITRKIEKRNEESTNG